MTLVAPPPTRTVDRPATATAAVAAGIMVAVVAAVANAGWVGVVVAVWTVPVVAAAMIDATTTRLPNTVVGPGAAVSFATAGVVSVVSGDSSIVSGAVVGAVVFGGWLLVVHLVSPTGLGFGDVKFAVLLGVGIGAIAPIGVVLVLVGSVVVHAVVMLVRPLPAQRCGVVDRWAAPYGPALAITAVGFVIVTVGFGTGGAM